MRYEIKKIITDKILWVILLAAILMTAYVSLNYGVDMYDANMDTMRVISDYTGAYDDNTVEEIENILENYEAPMRENEDYIMRGYYNILTQINKYNEINDYRKTVVKKADRLKNSKDSYTAALNQRMYDDFNNSIQFEIYYSVFIENALSNIGSYGTIIAVFLAGVLAIRIFAVDVENGMQSLIRSSKKGRFKVYRNKIQCLMAGNLIIIFITISILLLREFIYGNLTDFLQPVQSLTQFEKSGLSVNILELFGIVFIIQFIGMMIVSGISVIIACIFKRQILSLMVSVLITSISFFLYRYLILSNIVRYRAVFSNIFNDDGLFVIIISRFTNVFMVFMPHLYLEAPVYSNIFGVPVSTTFITVMFNVFIMCLLIVLGFFIYNRRYRKNGC